MENDGGGLPVALKRGLEALSGLSLDSVRVHRDSDRPEQLEAAAFARGADIHLAAGQQRHVPHEAWHVVQQREGRVEPTIELGGGPINDDPGLEREADRIGKAAIAGSGASEAKASGTKALRR